LKNQKLVERARRILMIAGKVDYESATKNLDEDGGHVKTALVMILSKVSAAEARRRLSDGDGFVRRAIGPQ